MDPIGPRALFVSIGSGAASLTGNSRAAQWMVLDQLVDEARGRISPESKFAMLTPAGRKAFAQFLDRRGLMVFSVNRASDIVQLLRWSKRQNVRVAVSGGAEAWEVADKLAAAKVPVFLDSLADLPQDFDQIGATLENAARLRAAGVPVAIQGAGSHHAVGDTLIQVDYRGTGSNEIEVFKWVGTGGNAGGGKLQRLALGSSNSAAGVICNAAGNGYPEDKACITTNTVQKPSPWDYTAKSSDNVGSDIWPARVFQEGGFDVTTLVGNVCFSGFMRRSSA